MKSFDCLADVRSVLLLGAHSDDIEIGVGATVRRLIAQRPDVRIAWVVFSGNEQRREEARRSAADFCKGVSDPLIVTHGYRDGYFPTDLAQIKDDFESLKQRVDPDLILTHRREDRHQDHRVISDLTWNTFRSHPIWEYEIPKWDGDLPQPNLYVTASEEHAREKTRLLMHHFGTQRSKHWFDEETFLGLMRLRGLESNTRYAEAFVIRKFVV